MRTLNTPEEIRDELFNVSDYLLTLNAQLQSLNEKKKTLLETGDTSALRDVDAEISKIEALVSRAQRKREGLLDRLAPFAQISAHYGKDTSMRETLERWKLLRKIIRWLDELELEPDDDKSWITTGLQWFLDDSYTDYGPWLDWKFSD